MILNSPIISGSLTVTGNISTSGSITLSGSVASSSFAATASFVALAQSASNAVSAQTASFANALTVASTLTAQTLVVQTITSSVDYVTGSTRFGSISENTHVFTGSVLTSGSIGVGITPSNPIEILGATAGSNNGLVFVAKNASGADNGLALGLRYEGGSVRAAVKLNFENLGSTINSYIAFTTDTSERMRITNSGNVGIGTTSPTSIGTNYTTLDLRGSIGGGINFGVTGSTYAGLYADSGGVNLSTNYNIPISFGISGSEKMRITSGGSVGIGTASPSGAAGLAFVLYSGASQGRICIKTSATGDNAGSGLQILMSGVDASIEQRENAALTFATNASERIRITSGGNILINRTTSFWSGINALEINGTETIIGMTNGSTSYGYLYHNGTNLYISNERTGVSGNVIFNNNGAERMRITSAGNVGINTSGNICKFVVADTGTVITSGDVTFDSQAKGIELYNNTSGTTDNLIGYWFSVGPHKSGIASGRTNAGAGWELDLRFFVHDSSTNNLNHCYEKMRLYGGGNLTINGSLTQNGSLSDLTLKENLVKILNPLDKVSQINGYTFTWKENAPARQHISNIINDAGLIAQEVEEVLPEIVRQNEDGTKALNYNGITGLLIEAIKELKAQNDDLQSQINELKAQ